VIITQPSRQTMPPKHRFGGQAAGDLLAICLPTADRISLKLAHPARFELTTSAFGGQRSCCRSDRLWSADDHFAALGPAERMVGGCAKTGNR